MTAKTTSTWSVMPSTADNGATTTCNGSAAPTITRLNDYWHIAFESWNIHENNVPNANNPAAAALVANGGTPFSPQVMPFNSPNTALCPNATVLTCTTDTQTFLLYVNYSPNKLNNFSHPHRMVRRP